MTIKRFVRALPAALFFAAAACPTSAQKADGNANIVRTATGTHTFFEEDGVTVRGREYFRMIVHGDGSRTMILTKDMFSDDRHHNIVMRVDEVYRPMEVFGSYWHRDGFKGSVRITLEGDRLHAASWGPGGRADHVLAVPHAIAIVTHGEGLNGWNASVADPDDKVSGGPVDMPRASYFITPVRDFPGPVLGSFRAATLTRVGEETITVPAGTFETIHYSTGPLDVWAMKGDRIMVRQVFAEEEYLLTSYQAE